MSRHLPAQVLGTAGVGSPMSHVVAIGASAGGLDALEKVFSGLPADTGAAFVVIQHLSPDHKSMMASLLARHTTMPVQMVEDGMSLAPNAVFLIPPGTLMRVDQGRLRLTPKVPRMLTLPIDVFFHSLAEAYRDRAVAVVLSGTGSDGTRGATSINASGGLLIAQEPETAKFDGMPRSVIGTGLVDVVLPVDQIAPRLVAHIHRAPIHEVPTLSLHAEPPTPEGAHAAILHLLRQVGGINFEEYKPATVIRRIERRMAVCRVGMLDAYLALLHRDRSELLTLRREILIPVTSFFRDSEAFEALARQVIEPLVAGRGSGDVLRVWVAGTSTGEEAYSIGMLFLEAFDAHQCWPALKIFATDVEQSCIEVASAGVYPESIAAEISPERLERFFLRKGNEFLVKTELRQSIVFARHNLLADPPFTRIDLVTCRNTLIYFKAPAQDRVLRHFEYALGPGAYLFLGSSESIADSQHAFQPLHARQRIWQRTGSPTPRLELVRSERAAPGSLLSSRRRGPLAGVVSDPRSPVEQGFAALLKAYAPPPAVLVNGRHELVHSYSELPGLLRVREGQASLDLARMLPPELVPVVSALLFKCARDNARVGSGAVRINAFGPPGVGEDPGASVVLRLVAWPVGMVEGERYLLLTFERVAAGDAPGEKVLDVSAESNERLEVLEHELAATRETLQATIEELETSNEELQATNEELMASNEELQSSNEELQSVNEELNTVNAEYQEKIEILNRLHADLESLVRIVAVGTVFVDEALRLTRYTPEASRVFKLRDRDVGRPLDELVHELHYPDLIRDLRLSLERNQLTERQVQANDGTRYLVRMLPYRIPSSGEQGAVLSFVDVTALHDSTRLQAIIDALGQHIAVLDLEGRIVQVNRAWREFAAENGDPQLHACGPGSNYLEVCRVDPDLEGHSAGAAADGIRAVLEGRSERFGLEYPCESPTEPRWFVMQVARLTGETPGAVVSHVNITAWRAAQHRT
jgi:two-component system CheB/CheR fusion protein